MHGPCCRHSAISYALRAREARGHRAVLLRQAAGRSERAPGEPLPEPALHAGERVYVNFLGEEAGNRVRQAYGARTYERLVELKRAYDPTNFFRLNQNIAP
jgi:hypothetical protein